MAPRLRVHGELEQAIMDILWSSADPLTARQVQASFSERTPAITTVTTVIERLRGKGWVRATEEPRARLYSASRTREEHTAELMSAALTATDDRSAALLHFAGTLSNAERDVLRHAIRHDPPPHNAPDNAPDNTSHNPSHNPADE
jgi:predicted transcriptional regulator